MLSKLEQKRELVPDSPLKAFMKQSHHTNVLIFKKLLRL